LNRQIQEDNDQRQAEAIADYEASLNYYLSTIALLEDQILDIAFAREVAYADFEAKHGSPFVRFRNYCGNAEDFFGCVNEGSAMRMFETEITQVEQSISSYNHRINLLVDPY